jgi:glycosyltransferase involved in cell wall biosynthesis
MPVFNGQRYVAQAIQSIVSQTFTDWELIISDNASTDGTSNICQSLANRDRRISYSRLPENVGAVANYNRVFRQAGGQYFKWAAHDDLIEPTFIQRCVDTLDADPSAVLAYPRARFIDENGNFAGDYRVKLATDSNLPSARFAAIALANHKNTHNLEIFGLMRRAAMDMIPPQGGYAASDRVFLARLALCGRFVEVPEPLFLSRQHPQQSMRTLPKYLQRNSTLISRMLGHGQLPPAEWFDPKYTERITFPEWRLLWEYLSSVQYGWLNTRVRAACIASVVLRQLHQGNWARMCRDFVLAGDKLVARVVQSMQDPPRPAPQIQPRPLEPIAPKAAA